MPRTKRDYAERLAEIEQRETAAKVKIDAIRAEKRRLQNREREKERKARTKRLIEIGAVMEHVLGRPIEHGDLPALQEAVEQFEHAEKSSRSAFELLHALGTLLKQKFLLLRTGYSYRLFCLPF